MESLKTAFLHYGRAANYHGEISVITINTDSFRDKETVKTIDAFTFRFLKLQDFMGNKLFKDLLVSIGAYQDSMTPLDMLDKLEKMRLINSSDAWMAFCKISNQLTHEYPNNTENVVEGIKLALKSFKEIEQILKNTEQYIKQKSLK